MEDVKRKREVRAVRIPLGLINTSSGDW